MYEYARFELSSFNQNSTTKLFSKQYHSKKINTLFAGLGKSVLGKTVPSVLSTALGHHTQDLEHGFYQYGPPSQQITYIIYFTFLGIFM